MFPESDLPPEVDCCSYCGEHAEWELDEEDTWRSTCCQALPIPVDVEPDEFFEYPIHPEDDDEQIEQ